jgi:hypothetical protein
VVLLDEFDHFGQIFGDKNVSIDSLTFDQRQYEKIKVHETENHNQSQVIESNTKV